MNTRRLVLADLGPGEHDLVDLGREDVLALDLHHVVPTPDRARLDHVELTAAAALRPWEVDGPVARPEPDQRRCLLLEVRDDDLAHLARPDRLQRVRIDDLDDRRPLVHVHAVARGRR